MNDKLLNVQKKAIQYWFVDGLAEIAAGLVGIFLAVLFWVWLQVFTWRWSLPILLVSALAVSFGLRLIIQRIKDRATYPRTGYVSPFSGMENKRTVVILIAFLILLVCLNYFLSTKGPQGLMWSPGLAGIIFSAIFFWVGLSTKLNRFFFLTFISLFVGLMLVLIEIDYFRGMSILTGIIGLVLLIQGNRIRKKYLRHSSMIDEPSNE